MIDTLRYIFIIEKLLFRKIQRADFRYTIVFILRERSNMISRQGGSRILEKCEDHYIKSHKKCEDGGVKIVKKGV